MSDFRENPCIYYNCNGDCSMGVKKASYKGKCQTCKKYKARKGYKEIGNIIRKKKLSEWVE